MYPFYLGLDLHNRKTYAVLMDRNGERYEFVIWRLGGVRGFTFR